MKRNSSRKRLPTICFVLAAKDLGLYADMAAVAALAVRRLHPQARTILVTDEPTARALDHGSHALGNIVSEIIVQPTGTDDPIVSSRRLKTVLRQLVKGDYLYLDNDAIAVRPLNREWPEGADLAVARDWNERGIPQDALPTIEKLRAKLGWKFLPDHYFNAGVIFVRDTPSAHAFYAEWHRRWRQAISLGVPQDQPSLNSAITAGVASVAILPDRDNLATNSTAMLRGRARIFHFWARAHGGEIPLGTLLGHLVARFQRDGGLDGEAIRRAARDDFPWVVKPLLARGLYCRAMMLMTARVMRRFFPGRLFQIVVQLRVFIRRSWSGRRLLRERSGIGDQ
jgi:hypothetical protein